VDGSYQLDLDALRDSIRDADHVLIRFTPIAERLFIDFRSNETEGPDIALLPQVSSFVERLDTIKQVRPGFPKPERLFVVTWPLRVRTLDSLGVLDLVKTRLAAEGAFDVMPKLDTLARELQELERAELRKAIIGEGYHTLWPQLAPS